MAGVEGDDVRPTTGAASTRADRRRWRVVVVAVTVAALGGTVAGSSAAAPTVFGLASVDWRDDLPAFTRVTGRSPAIHQLFWTLELDWPNAWAPAMLEEHRRLGVVPYVELTTDDLDAVVTGERDPAIGAMLDSLLGWFEGGPDRRLLVAPFPEPNLVEHAWGGDPPRFRAAFRRVVRAFRRAGLGPRQVRFVWGMNGISSPGLDHLAFYPGDQVVDVIGFSSINRGDPWRDYAATFATHIRALARVSRTSPMLVTRTGTVAPRRDWLEAMFAGLLRQRQVVGAVYVNRDKGGHDLRIVVDGDVAPAAVAGVRTWSPPAAVGWLFDGRAERWSMRRAGRLLIGDWDGDGRDEPGWFRDGRFRLRRAVHDSNRAGRRDRIVRYGRRGDVAVVGDWDGDGRDTVGVVRGRRWLLRDRNTSGPATRTVAFGRSGDRPVVGDVDGDGRDEIGVVRGRRWVVRGGRRVVRFRFGRPGDDVLLADLDGDGHATAVVRRGDLWRVLRRNRTGAPVRRFRFGPMSGHAVAGRWHAGADADGIGVEVDARLRLRDRATAGEPDRTWHLW